MASLDTNAWFVPAGGYDINGGVDPAQISIDNSICTLNAVYSSMLFTGGPGQTPATLPVRLAVIMWNKMVLLYGTVEVRGKFSGLGTHSAFWMFDSYDRTSQYQANNWPHRPPGTFSDEIDIAESCPGQHSNNPTILNQNTFAGNGQSVLTTTISDITANFHTYKMVWTPSSVTFYVDGIQTNQILSPVPQHPCYFLCDLELDASCIGTLNSANFPTSNQIDYVKAWDSNNNLVFSDDFDGNPAYQDLTMSNLVFAQAAGSTPAVNVASAALAYGSNTASQSYLLAYALVQGSSTLTSVTDTLGNTWSQKYAGPGPVYFFHCPQNVINGGADTVTFHFSAASQSFILLGIMEYTGQNPSNPFEGNTGFIDQPSGTPWTTGQPITTQRTNNLVLACGFTSATAPITGTNGFTTRIKSGQFLMLDAPANTIGTYTPAASASVGGEWDLNTVSLISSSSVGGGVGPMLLRGVG